MSATLPLPEASRPLVASVTPSDDGGLPSGAIVAPSQMTVPAVTAFKGEERLNLSRERMRLWLETSRGGKLSPRLTDRAKRSSWFASIRGNPAVDIGLGAVSAWWSSHPLRAATALASGLARSTIGPAARQKPFTVIGVGLVAGIVAVWARPWRWILRPALFVGLATQVLNRVVSEMPLESLLKVFTAFAGGSRSGVPARNAASAASMPAAVAPFVSATESTRAPRAVPSYER